MDEKHGEQSYVFLAASVFLRTTRKIFCIEFHSLHITTSVWLRAIVLFSIDSVGASRIRPRIESTEHPSTHPKKKTATIAQLFARSIRILNGQKSTSDSDVVNHEETVKVEVVRNKDIICECEDKDSIIFGKFQTLIDLEKRDMTQTSCDDDRRISSMSFPMHV